MSTSDGGAKPGPLAGLKVLDFGTFVAGTYNAVMLGELGAEVIKVESLEGDSSRYLGPFMAGESRAFVGWNRNKRGIALDLQHPKATEIIHKLVPQMDIVTENFRPGVTARLKLDYAMFKQLNPRVIYCSSTGFGTEGPLRDRPSYDAVLQTMGGVAVANAVPAGKTTLSTPVLIDMHTAMLGATGILAALYHRERTGEGQLIETSLLQGVMSLEAARFARPVDIPLEGVPGGAPYGLYATADSFIFVSGLVNKHWHGLCRVLGDDELGKDPRLQTMANRVVHAAEIRERMEAILRSSTSAEWEALLVGADVPCAVPQSHDEFFSSEQVRSVDMDPVIGHSAIGRLQVYGTPWKFEKTPSSIQRSAPTLGEHTGEILGELGYSEAELESFRTERIIS